MLLWPQGSRREKEVGFLCCQLLSPEALLLVSRLFPSSFSTFMVLNLPFFLPSDSASLWKSVAKNKDTQQPGERGSTEGRMGQWPASLSGYATTKGASPSRHRVMSLYPVSFPPLRRQAGALYSQLCNPRPTLEEATSKKE